MYGLPESNSSMVMSGDEIGNTHWETFDSGHFSMHNLEESPNGDNVSVTEEFVWLLK